VLYGLARQEFGLHLLANRPQGDAGYFAMLLSPPRTLAEPVVPRRFVQFVVDTSGSMAGDKIAQAKAALRSFVRSLRPDDVFQVVTFASSVQTFFDGPRAATIENVTDALARIDLLQAMGGTDIGSALQRALEGAMSADDGAVLLPQIVFVTDGQPTVGLTAPQAILAMTKQLDRRATRMFALGVGDDIDVRLLDDLVAQHRGARDFVRNQEKIEIKVDALCQKLAQPALTDVEVRCDGLDSFDVHPTRTRDLFCGEMLQVVGRYRDGGRKTVRVRGKQGDVEREFRFDVEFPQASEQHAFVQTLWARQHLATLLDAIRRHGASSELVEEVKRLATRYGIVTPYTSQLVVEEGTRLAGKTYRGPSDTLPALRGGGPGGPSAPAPAGPSASAARRGPANGGAQGPASAGPDDPTASASDLARLGRTRTGAEAVEESLETGADTFHLGARRQLRAGDRAERELVRRASGRVFVLAGATLVEQGLPADWLQRAVALEAFSADYFELLRKQPSLRDAFALGDRIAFRDGDRIVHVRPAPLPESRPSTPPTAPK
jgi:Ca-activated chloride channel family protein